MVTVNWSTWNPPARDSGGHGNWTRAFCGRLIRGSWMNRGFIRELPTWMAMARQTERAAHFQQTIDNCDFFGVWKLAFGFWAPVGYVRVAMKPTTVSGPGRHRGSALGLDFLVVGGDRLKRFGRGLPKECRELRLD